MPKITNIFTAKVPLGPGIALAPGQARNFTDAEYEALDPKRIQARLTEKKITVDGVKEAKPKAEPKPKAETPKD